MAGRGGIAPGEIINQNEIMNDGEIRFEKIVLRDIFINNLTCIYWLVKHRLLRNMCFCRKCEIPMLFIKKSSLKDGYPCHLTLNQIEIIVYCWCCDMSQRNITCEAGLGPRSTHAGVNWCNFCRDICEHDLIDNPTVIGGFDDDFNPKIYCTWFSNS